MQFTFQLTARNETTTKRLLDRYGVSYRLFKRMADGHAITVKGKTVGNVPLASGDQSSLHCRPTNRLFRLMATWTFYLKTKTGWW